MATPKEFSVGQGFHQPLVPIHGQDGILGQIADEVRSSMRQEEIGRLTGGDKRSWHSLTERAHSIIGRFQRVDTIRSQSEVVRDEFNLSSALLTNMALEVSFAHTFNEIEKFLSNKNMPAVKEYLDSAVKIQRLAISMPVGPMSIAEFIENGGEPEMAKKSLGLLVDAQVNGDSPQDLSYEGLMTFDARKIIRAGIIATQSDRFLTGTNSRIPRSVDITETIQGFVDNISKTQENTLVALLNPDDEEVKNEFSRLFDCENASAFVCCSLGFRDGREAMLFIKQMQKVGAVTSKDIAFYATLSDYLLDNVRKNDPNSIVMLNDIYDSSVEATPEAVNTQIREEDFEESINMMLHSLVPIEQTISPQETHGLLNPDDIAIELSDEYATADLVWDTNQGGSKVTIRLDRKAHTIDWSILNDINSPEVSQKREILLSYVLDTFNLTADSVRPKKVEDQPVVVSQKVETGLVRENNRVRSEKESVHPQVKIDCPIEIDLRKVEALILSNNIKTIHRKKVLEALEAWNMGRRRMLRRTGDGSFVLSVGKVTVSLQEVGDVLSVLDINSSK